MSLSPSRWTASSDFRTSTPGSRYGARCGQASGRAARAGPVRKSEAASLGVLGLRSAAYAVALQPWDRMWTSIAAHSAATARARDAASSPSCSGMMR